jgi:hypothetical protein
MNGGDILVIAGYPTKECSRIACTGGYCEDGVRRHRLRLDEGPTNPHKICPMDAWNVPAVGSRNTVGG